MNKTPQTHPFTYFSHGTWKLDILDTIPLHQTVLHCFTISLSLFFSIKKKNKIPSPGLLRRPPAAAGTVGSRRPHQRWSAPRRSPWRPGPPPLQSPWWGHEITEIPPISSINPKISWKDLHEFIKNISKCEQNNPCSGCVDWTVVSEYCVTVSSVSIRHGRATHSFYCLVGVLSQQGVGM